ncbi:MAG TPA: hypothetical protein VFX70_01345 [Mycobacteriales bacterium]|nr:hypothetical protein [Mycobacteriales bacterium]
MRRRGMNYDVGTANDGVLLRPVFDPRVVRRELEIIRDDLHCTAVRISGLDPDRLMPAAEDALRLGLEVWLSPQMSDHSPEETLDYVVRCATDAEALRRRRPGLVFMVGCELSLFMRGILPGDNLMERIGGPAFVDSITTGAHNAPLNAFLTEAADTVHRVFAGEVTYASVPFERVDWSLFDFVCLDHYREARNRPFYDDQLRPYLASGKPVVVTEFGCCTYRGAEDAGGMGWAIIEDTTPPRLDGDYVRDEGVQARELTDLLGIVDRAGVDGAFVFTFVMPAATYSDDPRFDLDMASYGLVKSFSDRTGTTYPDLPWEPKESFHAVRDYFAGHGTAGT